MGAPLQTAARTPLGLQGAYCGPPWLFRWIRSPWVTTAGSEPDAGMDFGSCVYGRSLVRRPVTLRTEHILISCCLSIRWLCIQHSWLVKGVCRSSGDDSLAFRSCLFCYI